MTAEGDVVKTYQPGEIVRILVGKVRTPNGYRRTRSATVLDQRGRYVRVRPFGQRPTVVDVEETNLADREHARRRSDRFSR
jgi:hypothetical protein